MSDQGAAEPAGPISMVYAVAALALVFAVGAVAQLMLVGLSTFDSARYWSDHVTLGRLIGLPALLLPVFAVLGKLDRRLVLLSGAVAVLYVIQTLLTHIGGGPMGALHALNSVPLIGIPLVLGFRAYEITRSGSRRP